MGDTAPEQLTWRWRLIATVIVALVRLLRWRIDVRGLEHVPPSGGAVIAFNHHPCADFMMVGWPIVPVDRGSPGARAAAFDAAVTALRVGDPVAVAPEQTLSPSFELLPLRTGAARMAKAAGVGIVPVAGWGTQRALTKGGSRQMVRRLPVSVRFGPPLHAAPEDDPGSDGVGAVDATPAGVGPASA